jgi:hypothetical protein
LLNDIAKETLYPSVETKKELSSASSLTYKQVTRWFQNQRELNKRARVST